MFAGPWFQSTRPHGARHGAQRLAAGLVQVSIHAPARGATTTAEAAGPCLWSFNPRARTGRDQRWRPRRRRTRCFNPRARTGRDRGRSLGAGVMDRVSIHAPARGATPGGSSGFPTRRSFNPRARTGRDGSWVPATRRRSGFNPRARTGRDATVPNRQRPDLVSIHAPARGATSHESRKMRPGMFQSTRPHGARRFFCSRSIATCWFQSTRPHGARRWSRLR